MSEMVERGAIALMRTRWGMGKPAHLQPEKQSKGGILLPISIQQEHWDECVRDSRAVIMAMREPTTGMLIAACTECAKEQVRPIAIHRIDADTVWRAMIGEALK